MRERNTDGDYYPLHAKSSGGVHEVCVRAYTNVSFPDATSSADIDPVYGSTRTVIGVNIVIRFGVVSRFSNLFFARNCRRVVATISTSSKIEKSWLNYEQ